MNDVSPAVERAVAAAEQSAGLAPLRLAHLLLALLEDDEGRPAVIFQSLGVSLDALRAALNTALPESLPSPPVRKLLSQAREWSLENRADPNILSDAFLLAVLQADSGLIAHLQPHGIHPETVQRQMIGEASPVAVPEPTAMPDPLQTSPEVPVPHPELRPSELGSFEARVVDANLNRARESLRVLDDYCRFVLDDRFLTEQFKTLRHRLVELTRGLPTSLLLASRETLQDVGTTLMAAGEYQRASTRAVAAANLKRLQESLRSLEEFGKILSATFAQGVEQLRYTAYTLERVVVRGTEMRERLADAWLYVLLTGSQCRHGLERTITAAASGGADVFQLREKDLNDRSLLDLARNVRRWTRDVGVLFVVNDRPDIAYLSDADGVHLGQDDLAIREARRMLPPEVMVGVSTHSIDQVRQAVLDGADYLGVGPIFPSRTKSFENFPGLDFITAAISETSLPAFALGGIGLATIADAVVAGARRVAVSAAVAEAEDPATAARQLRIALEAGDSPAPLKGID